MQEAAFRSGGFSKISAEHFGCSTARNKGETQCSNRLTLRHDRPEREVLEALKSRLMAPEIFRRFVDGFTAEWNRLQAEASAGQASRQQELERIDRQLNKLVNALVEGVLAMVRDRMAVLGDAQVGVAGGSSPRLGHRRLACIRASRRSTATWWRS